MALKNLAKGLTIRGLIIDARVLRLLPGETLAKRVEAPRSPLAMLSEEHTWARDRVKGMRGSEIREELTQRGAPVDGEPWELEASLARLLAESGPPSRSRAATVSVAAAGSVCCRAKKCAPPPTSRSVWPARSAAR